MSWERVHSSGPWQGLSPGWSLASYRLVLPVASVQAAENQLRWCSVAIPKWVWRGLPHGCPLTEHFVLPGEKQVRGKLMQCKWQSLLVTAKAGAELLTCRSKHRSPSTCSITQQRAARVPDPMRGGHGFPGRLKCRMDSANCKLYPLETQVASGSTPNP